jgi:2-(1,2-epoxy-1,2-dihydrophenyl)acetyl-CoA isomerase
VAVVTLNRPAQLNALGGDVHHLLGDYLVELGADHRVRCVVLTGAGRGFCSGGDIHSLAGRDEADGAGRASGVYVAHERLVQGLYRMPKPVIAMVNGVAAGAGACLAMACDIRIASDKARFVFNFRNIAASGDYGGSYLLQHLVGYARALELYFTAAFVEPDEALRIGLVNRVVPHEQLEESTLALARELAAGPTFTYAAIKENFHVAANGDLQTALDQEARTLALTLGSKDHPAAVRAFLERRPPVFTGE